MTNPGTLEYYGLRLGQLGSATDLVVSAPLADGDTNPAARTDANRIGMFFSRGVGVEGVGTVVMGVTAHEIRETETLVLGNPTWHEGTLPDPEVQSNRGASNGYAPLDASAKVPTVNMPTSILGGMAYKGAWDADTNTPGLASGVGADGDYYWVSVAGSTNLDGISTWNVNDFVVFNGTVWERVPDDGANFRVKASAGDLTAGYLADKVDNVTIIVNGSDQLEVVGGGGGGGTATSTTTNTAAFDKILSAADTNVQLALNTLDEHTHALDGLSDVVKTTQALTDAVAVPVDNTTAEVVKWFIQINDGTNYLALEVLSAAQGDEDTQTTVYPGTASYSHTVAVSRVAGSTSLSITADGVGYTAVVRRVVLT